GSDVLISGKLFAAVPPRPHTSHAHPPRSEETVWWFIGPWKGTEVAILRSEEETMQRSERRESGRAVFWTVILTLLVLSALILIVPFLGAIDVGATHSHLPGVHWFLETTQQRSVASRAAEIEPPGDLESPERVDRGLASYHQMCVGCHGAPGVEPGWMGQGLNPDPPELWRESERELTGAQAARDYWVIEHGIRMTGMPALAPTHDEEEIWDLVAFVQQLPQMKPSSYASAGARTGLSLESGHEHPGGGHDMGEERSTGEETSPSDEEHAHPEGDGDHSHEEEGEEPAGDEGGHHHEEDGDEHHDGEAGETSA
ncbi:MAG: c-type cytochrome, partial [Thermoanaerobaculia bacterium]|nr:c-type cytochrome [Thermoanaerobaculia bacterium]